MKIRPAENNDVQTMVRIIGHYASEGLMLPRSHGALTEAVSHYLVADHNGEIVGCGGLEPYSQNVAEIYGLATSPENSPRGTGSAIVKALIDRARRENLSQVFALTLAPGFFQKMGFRIVEHKDLPMKVWRDCVSCPKFGNCDEIAMVLDLN
jgi:amino-acid N-acetyltransferase